MVQKFNVPCALSIGLALPIMTGCAHVNVNQIAYEVLRQEDCRINQLDEFCTRTFAADYYAYERLRQEYLRDQTQQTWRVSHSELTLSADTQFD